MDFDFEALFPSVPMKTNSNNQNNNMGNQSSTNNFGNINYNINNRNNEESEKYIENLLLKEFREYIMDEKIGADICHSYLFSSNNSPREAAKLFFQDKYGSKALKIVIVFPNKTEKFYEHDFLANVDDLFIPLFTEVDNIQNPSYFLGNRKIEVNPLKDKIIAHLNIPSNSKLYVK